MWRSIKLSHHSPPIVQKMHDSVDITARSPYVPNHDMLPQLEA